MDLNKEYDNVTFSYMFQALRALNFPEQFI